MAVDRETERRHRALLTFVALLAVPVAIGAYAVSRAQTETMRVVTDVTPVVTRQVGSQLAGRVTNDVVERTRPLIRRDVSAVYTSTILPQIDAQRSAINTGLAIQSAAIQKANEFAETARPQLDLIPQLQTHVTDLAATASRAESAANELAAANRALSNEVAQQGQLAGELSNKMNALTAEQQNFAKSVGNDLAALRSSGNANAQTVRANQEAINALNRRVAALEKNVAAIDALLKDILRPKG